MSDLVRELAHVFHEIADKPYVLFGHSLGSRVAYEFAQQCQSFGLPRPKLLIASGSRAPHIPNERASIHDLPEVEFIAKLRELNGTPEEVLSNRELIQFLIPLLRADFRIAEKYQSVPRKLGCPILALAGKEDLEVTELSVESWRELSNGKCEIHWIPGGHFFIEENRPLVLEKVNAALAEIGRITHVA
jgi:surfactin synthase thioesterase subunit